MILKHFDTMPCSFCTGRKVTRQVILEAIMAPFATALYLIEFSFGPDSQDCYRSLDHLCVGPIVKFRDLLYLTTTYGSSSHRYFIRLHPSAREIIWQTPPPWRNWHSLQKTAVICGYFQIYSVELKIVSMTQLWIGQHYIRWRLSAIRIQGITWTKFNPDLRRQMESLGNNI